MGQGFWGSAQQGIPTGMAYAERMMMLDYQKSIDAERLKLQKERDNLLNQQTQLQIDIAQTQYDKVKETEAMVNSYVQALGKAKAKPIGAQVTAKVAGGKKASPTGLEREHVAKLSSLETGLRAKSVDPRFINPDLKLPSTSEDMLKRRGQEADIELTKQQTKTQKALEERHKAQSNKYNKEATEVGEKLGLSASENSSIRQIVKDEFYDSFLEEWNLPEGMTYRDVFREVSYDIYPHKIPKGNVSMSEPKVQVGLNAQGKPTVTPTSNKANTQNAIHQIQGQLDSAKKDRGFIGVEEWKKIKLSMLKQEEGELLKSGIDIEELTNAIHRLQ